MVFIFVWMCKLVPAIDVINNFWLKRTWFRHFFKSQNLFDTF